ncbi:MAG: hypothetical protein ACLGIZ_10015 [Acidimicrobiia bacterium]
MITRLAAALVAALLLVACGDEPDGRYDAQVDRVRSAVESGDREAALASLDELGTDAFQAHAAGEITDDELAELAALLEQARMQVDEEIPEATTTTTTTTAPPTTAPAPVYADSSEERDDDKKDKGKGRRDDDGEDDDDD